MRIKLIVENNNKETRVIGIYTTQEALDGAFVFFGSSLEEGDYFATIPLGASSEEEDLSALEMAEIEADWTDFRN